MKESFILYTKQYKAIKALTLSQKGRLLDALFTYAIDGQTPTFKDEVVRVAFDFMRIQIDLDADKYTAKCQRNKEIALERERKRKEHERVRTCTNVHERTPNDNDNDNDNDNSNELNNNTQKKEEKKAHASDYDIEEHIKDFKRTTPEENKRMVGVIRMFNEEVRASGSQIQCVSVLTPQRIMRLRRIFIDYTDPQIRLAFQHATQSAYLNGKTKDRHRPADFDWIIKYDNFTRIFEGAV